MKLSHLVVVMAVALVSGVSAQEFGIVSATNGGLNSSAKPLSFSQRLEGSYSLPFDQKGGGLEFRAHGQVGLLPSPLTWGYDVDQLAATLVFQKPATDLSALKWTLGRFDVGEPTGLVLNHPGDGTRFVFSYSGATLTVLAAYTGLILRESSGLTPSLADLAAADALLASPRLIGSVEGSFSPVRGHTLTVSALAQQDLNPRKNLTPEWETVYTGDTGGTLDTQYLTLMADGAVTDTLYYEAFGTFGAGSTLSWLSAPSSVTGFLYEYKPIVSYLAGTSFTLYLPDVLSSSFTARILASSGDADASSTIEGNTKGDSNLFIPYTSSSLGTVFSPALSNLIYYELGGTLKPMGVLPLVLSFKALGFQRSLAGVINATGVLRGGPLWMGQELDLGISWQPLSDLSVSLSTGAYLPTAGTFAPGTPEAGLQYAVKTGVNLSL